MQIEWDKQMGSFGFISIVITKEQNEWNPKEVYIKKSNKFLIETQRTLKKSPYNFSEEKTIKIINPKTFNK